MFKDTDITKLVALGYKPVLRGKPEPAITVSLWVETLGMVQDDKTKQVYAAMTRKPYKGKVPKPWTVSFVPNKDIRTVRITRDKAFIAHPRELIKINHHNAAVILQ